MGRGAAWQDLSCLSPSPWGEACWDLAGPSATCRVTLGQVLNLSGPQCYLEYPAGNWTGPDDPSAAHELPQTGSSVGPEFQSLLCHLLAVWPGSGI